MKSITVEEAQEFIRLQTWSDPRWEFAIMKGPDGGRWMIGSRCSKAFPLFSLDQCEFETVDAAFNAFLHSPLWEIFVWQCQHSVEDFKEAAMETRLQIDTPNLKDYRGYNFGLPAHVANKARREAKRLNVPWPLLLEPNFEKNPELKIPWNHGDAYNWDMSVKKPGDPPNAYGE